MYFRLYPLRFTFVARESVRFTPGHAGNLVRGAFGTILRRIACAAECKGASGCEHRAACAYARMFEPAASGRGPSGLRDWPRPFVLRAARLDGLIVSPDQHFSFDMHLFDMQQPCIAPLIETFGELAREGIGPGRGRVELLRVEQFGEAGETGALLYEMESGKVREACEPVALSLDPDAEAVERVVVRFVTPMELKSGQRLAEQPDFGVLAARIRDRLSTLRELYDDGPLGLDFRGWGERAACIKMLRCDVKQVEATRRSSRTGQTHGIGGFVGEAEYAGDLREFMPFLRAARWTGVGRQTVWGKGEIAIEGGAGKSSNAAPERVSSALDDLVV